MKERAAEKTKTGDGESDSKAKAKPAPGAEDGATTEGGASDAGEAEADLDDASDIGELEEAEKVERAEGEGEDDEEEKEAFVYIEEQLKDMTDQKDDFAQLGCSMKFDAEDLGDHDGRGRKGGRALGKRKNKEADLRMDSDDDEGCEADEGDESDKGDANQAGAGRRRGKNKKGKQGNRNAGNNKRAATGTGVEDREEKLKMQKKAVELKGQSEFEKSMAEFM